MSEQIMIEGMNRFSVSEVVEVKGFSDKEVRLSLKDKSLYIKGEGLKITAFSKQNGNLSLDGKITELKIGGKKEGLRSKLFK